MEVEDRSGFLVAFSAGLVGGTVAKIATKEQQLQEREKIWR
jgi:hypothetical protein